MKIRYLLITFLMTAVFAPVLHAQLDLSKVCRLENGQLVFTLDKRWTPTQRREVLRVYALDSAVVAAAFAMKPATDKSGNIWTSRRIDANRVELSKTTSKTTSKPAGGNLTRNQLFLMDDKTVTPSALTDRESVPYGVNIMTRNTIIQSTSGNVTFFLPGYYSAKAVFLSGSFNNWSTGKSSLQRTDSGWIATLSLLPGKYTYKYIIDGKWTNDPYNKLREKDLHGGYNNVFYCYNYRFTLRGFSHDKNIWVAGSFNKWKHSELRLQRSGNLWSLPVYLREGTHSYKFIIDGKWVTDPDNKVVRPDGKGNFNSFLGIGDTLFFRLKGYSGAKTVAVAGNFNGWNASELGMTRRSWGWELPYVLAAGNYEYKFIVDGHWINDPENPSVTGDDRNSFLAVKPNYTFRLEGYSDAREVIVAGSFNNWNPSGYHMSLHNGVWTFPIYLKPGKYTYKFVVDKKWMLDPDNDLWENNEYGTGNSVIWIELPYMPF